LVDVFRQHHELAGQFPNVSLAQFEQAILARSFFNPNEFLVATRQDSQNGEAIIGWCHFGSKRNANATDEGADVFIAAVCLASDCEASVAVDLVDEAMRRCQPAGHNATHPPVITAGLFRDDHFGYAGLTPYSQGYGIENMDVRLHGVLQACGFVANRSIVRLVASTEGYRPAFSREAMQLRRSATVYQQRILPESIRSAAALSHLDIERHALVDRSGSVIGGMDFWFSDAEAQVMPASQAIMDIRPGAEYVLSPSDSYLVSAVVGALADRNIRHVDAVVESDQIDLINQLGKVCFTVASEGTLWKHRGSGA
jgi:hypothetical protein